MKTIEFKLLLKPAQVKTLGSWMRTCCWIYNRALEMRIKAWKRRKQSVSLYDQFGWLTKIRSRNQQFSDVPCEFERNAIRRVDRGFKAFFRRCQSGEIPGFPRFKTNSRYNSIEHSVKCKYVRGDNLVSIPRLGLVRIRCGNQRIQKTQNSLRIVRRASGWYGQVVVDESKSTKRLMDHGPIGVDVGLESFATLSDGSSIENPRFHKKSEIRLKSLQRSVSRKNKGSQNRKKAIKRLALGHEKVALQRRGFSHQVSTELVRKHPVIAVEKLNIKAMRRSKRFSKSISDAGWGIFTSQLKYKAANAGRLVVEVNPAGTSQECPDCGEIKKKTLSERTHSCACGLKCHRDHAAASVILARGLKALGSNLLRRDSAADSLISENQADPMKQEHMLSKAST